MFIDQLTAHPFHVVIEIAFAAVIAYLLLQRRQRRAARAAAAKAVPMPSLEEQERRIAAFSSIPFRAECEVTSNIPVDAFRGSLEVVAREGCHITVVGGIFADPTVCLDLLTYDYHSFSTHPDVVQVARATVGAYGVGSCGPRAFYGTIKPHLEFEEHLARFTDTEEAVVYSFSYATVATLVSCYASRGDYVVCDDGVNSAVGEGCTLSRCNLTHFHHNDMASLELALKAVALKDAGKPHRRFVVTEGLFKNTGDICPLPEIRALCAKYKFRLLLEDSFGFGALGATGRGTPEHFGIPIADIDVYVGSLSTSLGGVGGFCCGDSKMTDFQRLGATAYIFSASLPPYITASANEVLTLLEKDSSCVGKLQALAKTARATLREAKFNPNKIALVECQDDVSPVILLAVSEPFIKSKSAKEVENDLQTVVNAVGREKIVVSRHLFAVDEPVHNASSLRVVLKSEMSDEELKDAVRVIIKAVKAQFA